MKLHSKCLPCTVNQAIKVADMCGLENKNNLMKRLFTYLGTCDFEQMTTPELIGQAFQIIKEETGNEDPYKETRQKYNLMFLKQYDQLMAEINDSDNPFEKAIQYAIIGNIIDFNPIHELTMQQIQDMFISYKHEKLTINDTEAMIKDLLNSKCLLYLGDNCGEIIFDKMLIEKIKQLNPNLQIYFGVRGENVVNDSIEEDAFMVGINHFAKIISNGDCSLGTVLHRTSKKFMEIYHKADMVIAKGQANYECLSQENKNIYFLLMSKCDVIANDIVVDTMKMINLHNRNYI